MRPTNFFEVTAALFVVCFAGALGYAIHSDQPTHHPAAASAPVPTVTPTLTVQPDVQNRRAFYRAVNKAVPDLADDEDLLLGYGLCAELEGGTSIKSVAITIVDGGFTAKEGVTILDASIKDLCPSQLPALYSFDRGDTA